MSVETHQTPSQRGMYVEEKIHENLINHFIAALRENDIREIYGRSVCGIDHLFIDNEYNKVVAIQTKYHSKNIGLKDCNHFIKCCYDVYQKEKIPMICILLSKTNLTKIGMESFGNENIHAENLTFQLIQGENEFEMIKNLNDFLCNCECMKEYLLGKRKYMAFCEKYNFNIHYQKKKRLL